MNAIGSILFLPLLPKILTKYLAKQETFFIGMGDKKWRQCWENIKQYLSKVLFILQTIFHKIGILNTFWLE